MSENLEGKHLVGPDSTRTTVLRACIIQISPLLYFTLTSWSHVNEPRQGQGGKQESWIRGGDTLEQV